MKVIALLLLTGLFADSVRAAAYIKYDGVDGESMSDPNHDKWIDVLSIDWGAHKPGGGATGQSRRRGAAIVEDITLTIEYEKSSPKLQEKCLKGEIIPKLEIEIEQLSSADSQCVFGGDPREDQYLRYHLTNVLITSFSESWALDQCHTMKLSHNFERIAVSYVEYSTDAAGNNTCRAEYCDPSPCPEEPRTEEPRTEERGLDERCCGTSPTQCFMYPSKGSKIGGGTGSGIESGSVASPAGIPGTIFADTKVEKAHNEKDNGGTRMLKQRAGAD